MERLRSKRRSRRSMKIRLINEARALLSDETATVDQLNNIYRRLKVNNDDLNKINEELESHIAGEEFVQEYHTVVEYDDNTTSVMSELLSKGDHVVTSTPELRTSSATSTAGVSGAKLPKLTIAPFAAFRNMYNQIVINIRGLETLGVSKASFSTMLCDLLLRALRPDIAVQYHRSCAPFG
ncbi:hypothetical protein HPB50_003870 [Hyalomma asiaticum]|uniref:Uncharacterized protein n=1 Tax=Hyalomma asiaticum TaxID=266040 RepID=A0ACB7TC07_HYAAI|nr:hypothetical protein HPB50_003870 [Hyalomma asiaticum]